MQIYDTNLYKEKLLQLGINTIEPLEKYTTCNNNLLHKCLVCGGSFNATPSNIFKKRGCPYCSGKKVLIGYNDLWTTNPEVAMLLKDKASGYNITKGSNKKIEFICPNCKTEKLVKPNSIKDKLSCPMCSDGISYPEKFIYAFLTQLKIDFIYQYTKANKDWCKNYKYDFYFEFNNNSCIVEVMGEQHYTNSFKNGRSLEDEIKNDCQKKELAYKNGIKYYIQLDCRKSDYTYITNSIMKSKFVELFNLIDFDFLFCQNYALSSLVKLVCDEYNLNKQVIEISKKFKLSSSCVYSYLKQGSKLGLCQYIGIENNKYVCAKKVINLSTMDVFNSISEASRDTSTSYTSISISCHKKRKVNVKDKTNSQWMFYTEYINQNCKKISLDTINYKNKKIICLTTDEVFDSIAEAKRQYKNCDIQAALSKRQKTAGKNPITNEKLQWDYYNEVS